jgi:hypothetical protein
MAHRVNLKVLEPNLFHLVIGRVVFQTVAVAAIAVALLELGRVAVDDARRWHVNECCIRCIRCIRCCFATHRSAVLSDELVARAQLRDADDEGARTRGPRRQHQVESLEAHVKP